MSVLALRRKLTGEIMDSPALDPTEHLHALAGLRRINRASGAAESILSPLLQIAKRDRLARVTVLDVACGGGDVPVAVATFARQQNLTLDLTLFDRSERAVRQAAQAAAAAGIAHQTLAGDAVAELPVDAFDIVTNSLFLHHLTEAEAVAVLGNMRRAARRAVIISDLRRSRLGLFIAWAACRVLSRSRVVRYDGPVSVRAAWTVPELAALARRAGMAPVRIERSWPWRMRLIWERASGGGNGQ